MAFTPKDGQGALFKNAKKTADNHPDYRGSIMIGGVDYWLDSWLKKSKEGKTYMSLSAKPKDVAASQTSRPQVQDDSEPF